MTGWDFSGELLPEQVFDFLGQWIVEIIRDGELPFRRAKLKLSAFLRRSRHRHEFCERLTFVRNDDLFADGDAVKHAGNRYFASLIETFI
jgi:hypothetical protein